MGGRLETRLRIEQEEFEDVVRRVKALCNDDQSDPGNVTHLQLTVGGNSLSVSRQTPAKARQLLHDEVRAGDNVKVTKAMPLDDMRERKVNQGDQGLVTKDWGVLDDTVEVSFAEHEIIMRNAEKHPEHKIFQKKW